MRTLLRYFRNDAINELFERVVCVCIPLTGKEEVPREIVTTNDYPPASVFHKYNPGIPVSAEIGVVAVFISENMAEMTENSRLNDKHPTVDSHKLYTSMLGSF